MVSRVKILFLPLVFIFTLFPASGEEKDEQPVPFFPRPAVIAEKVVSELRMYRGGRYAEQIRRTEHGRITFTPDAVKGRYYILEDVIRDARKQGARVDASARVDLPPSALPEEWALERDPYPRLRPLPVLPLPVPAAGTVWKEAVTLSLFPEQSGKAIIVPATARYRYDGTGTFYGKRVHTASGYITFETTRCSGSYSLSITFSTDTGYPLFIKNTVDETFTVSGTELGYKGFVNHWFSYPELDNKDLIVELNGKMDEEEVEILKTDEGPALRLKELKFRPDSAALLPEEEQRLDRIAAALKKTESETVLIVGHTANIGNPEGQRKLSVERAREITEALLHRGISSNRLLYEGRGASEPLADNSTEEGRAQNRRVEIILIAE